MNFAIVRFTEEENAPGIVATNWLNRDNNICYFPTVKTDMKKIELLTTRAAPEEDWFICPVKILKEYASYSSARSNLTKAEYTSSLESSGVLQSKSKRNPSKCPHRSDSEERSSSEEIDQILCDSPQGTDSSNNELRRIKFNFSSLAERLEAKIDTLLGLAKQTAVTQRTSMSNNDEEENQFHILLTSLPAKTETVMTSINRQIAKKSSWRKKMISYFVSTDGRDVKSLASNILRKLLDDNIAACYSLTGKNFKTPFQNTEMFKIIFDVCIRKFPDSNEKIIREAVSDWLMQAKFRKSRRESRLHNGNGK